MSIKNIVILAFLSSPALSAMNNYENSYDDSTVSQLVSGLAKLEADNSIQAIGAFGAFIAGVHSEACVDEPARSYLEDVGIFNQGQKKVDPAMREAYLDLFAPRWN